MASAGVKVDNHLLIACTHVYNELAVQTSSIVQSTT